MGCVFCIPKEQRNCRYCTVEFCDERQHDSLYERGIITTAGQLMQASRKAVLELSSDNIPIKLNGRRVKIQSVEIKADDEYDFCLDIRYKYATPSASMEEIKEIILKKKGENK